MRLLLKLNSLEEKSKESRFLKINRFTKTASQQYSGIACSYSSPKVSAGLPFGSSHDVFSLERKDTSLNGNSLYLEI